MVLDFRASNDKTIGDTPLLKFINKLLSIFKINYAECNTSQYAI